jgi:tetratricopeptide (TPR) repeat protein
MSLRASVLAASLTVRACAPVVAAAACLLAACQSDAERARELLEGPGAGTGVSARDALVQATTLDPTLREAWARLADVELTASHWVEADAAAQRAIALSDTTPHEHEVRSRALAALERWSDAEPEILREIELGASEAPARTRLGKVQEHLDRADDAVASYRRAIELEGEEGELDAASVEARCALARMLLARLEPASEDDAWDGNEAGRTEIRSLLEGARAPASGTPFEEEVTSLSQSLSTLDQRATQLAASRAAREQVAQMGILALLGESAGGSPFGAAGLSDSLFGDQIEDAFGAGGLGLSGIGVGGGGGESIGLGSLGAIGHGGGVGSGAGVGYGSGGLGGGAGRLEGPGATVRVSATANGALDAAAITAVARRQSLQLRHCYETALRSDPALAGTMRIEVSVTAAGAAEGARASGFGDATLTECMSRSIGRAAFPPSSGTTSASVSVTCSATP